MYTIHNILFYLPRIAVSLLIHYYIVVVLYFKPKIMDTTETDVVKAAAVTLYIERFYFEFLNCESIVFSI